MKRSKKVFLALAVVFFLIVLVVGYDISRKTSFPGSKKYLKESILPSDNEPQVADTTRAEEASENNLE